MLHVQLGQGDDQKGALSMSVFNRGDHNGVIDWRKIARISAGFVVGILAVWAWQGQSETSTTILAVSIGLALGLIAFCLGHE